jgi:glutamate racemase
LNQPTRSHTSVSTAAPIGIFDSGVGGLSVLRAIRQQLPNERLVYLADQAHVPYGQRSLQEVRAYSKAITRYLTEQQGVKMVVVACNTASAAALHHLRAAFPETPFVGMEPAVKPAAENTNSGVVGVLATPATFQGELYASVVERFAQGVTVLQDTCPGLVAEIEAGRVEGEETRRILQAALGPMLEKGLDTVVLGCTHYPFVIPVIQEIVGPDVRVIDPAPAIARQTARLLDEYNLGNPGQLPGQIRYLTSGDPHAMAELLMKLLAESGEVQQVGWGVELRVE